MIILTILSRNIVLYSYRFCPHVCRKNNDSIDSSTSSISAIGAAGRTKFLSLSLSLSQ